MALDYNKLVQFYRLHNPVASSLSDEELAEYFKLIDERNNLVVECDQGGDIIGFIEFWRINYEQLGRIMVHGLIDARDEDTITGSICFFANTAIHPDFRKSEVGEFMKKKFFLMNYNCDFFCGDAIRKINKHTFNIYKRSHIFKHLKEEVKHG
jgi:ribosomal protein S18 acetylase RimI-like enzyme